MGKKGKSELRHFRVYEISWSEFENEWIGKTQPRSRGAGDLELRFSLLRVNIRALDSQFFHPAAQCIGM